MTINPVLDFYINSSWNTDTNSLMEYGTDGIDGNNVGLTGSDTGISGEINYHNFFKLLFNYNISSLKMQQ